MLWKPIPTKEAHLAMVLSRVLQRVAMKVENYVHPATKGIRHKRLGKKVTKKVTEASDKVTK